jgi:hypothetical protein
MTPGKRYTPSGLVVVDTATFVPVFVRVSFAPGTTALLESTTVPVRMEVLDWGRAVWSVPNAHRRARLNFNRRTSELLIGTGASRAGYRFFLIIRRSGGEGKRNLAAMLNFSC